MVQFPSALGQGSKLRKNYNILNSINLNSLPITNSNSSETRDYYFPLWGNYFTLPLLQENGFIKN